MCIWYENQRGWTLGKLLRKEYGHTAPMVCKIIVKTEERPALKRQESEAAQFDLGLGPRYLARIVRKNICHRFQNNHLVMQALHWSHISIPGPRQRFLENVMAFWRVLPWCRVCPRTTSSAKLVDGSKESYMEYPCFPEATFGNPKQLLGYFALGVHAIHVADKPFDYFSSISLIYSMPFKLTNI